MHLLAKWTLSLFWEVRYISMSILADLEVMWWVGSI